MKEISALVETVEQLRTLPGIGPKLAHRLAFNLVEMPKDKVKQVVKALMRLKEEVFYCSKCFHITDCDPCRFCSDDSRDQQLLCVVESPRDVEAMEKSRNYNGVYHVLHGVLSPLNGIGAEDIKLKELLVRMQSVDFKEIILATNPNVEGEATALYITKLIQDLGIKITRIGHGVPMGIDIEYADEMTLAKSLEYRTVIANKKEVTN